MKFVFNRNSNNRKLAQDIAEEVLKTVLSNIHKIYSDPKTPDGAEIDMHVNIGFEIRKTNCSVNKPQD